MYPQCSATINTAMSLQLPEGRTVFLVLSLLATYVAVTVIRQTRVLKDVPGPPSPSLLLGHVLQRRRAPAGTLNREWMKVYGHAYKTYGMLLVSERSDFA